MQQPRFLTTDDNSAPHRRQGHHQGHGRDHVGYGEIFQLEHPESGGQEQGASAGLEIPDHVRGAEGKQGIGQNEQAQEDHQLGQGDEADDDPQFTGKKGRRRQVHDGLGDEDAVIPGHAGHHAAVDTGAAGTEQHNDGDQPAFIFFPGNQAVPGGSGQHPADHFLQVPGSVDDPVPQADPQAHNGAGNHREHHRRQIFHEGNGNDPHQKSTGAEHRGQLFLEIL